MAADRIEDKWIVTAVNNLTGEREAISRPHSRWKTEELLTKARRDTMRHRKHAAYSLHRMERVPDAVQQNLNFTPPIELRRLYFGPEPKCAIFAPGSKTETEII